eukprot:SAG11_NODE_24909_length_366_cov_0.775281_1_plen_26_part_01
MLFEGATFEQKEQRNTHAVKVAMLSN